MKDISSLFLIIIGQDGNVKSKHHLEATNSTNCKKTALPEKVFGLTARATNRNQSQP
jgi:hypothetical protein